MRHPKTKKRPKIIWPGERASTIKQTVLTLIVLAALMSAQQEKETGEISPCDHRIIQKAKEKGLNSLSVKEIPQFWFAVVRCKLEARKGDKKVDFGHLYRQKQNENFEKARELSGLGTCLFTVTGLTLLYFYLGFIAGAD